MNPHFLREFGRGEIPPSVYARVDSVEIGEDETIQIGLDAVSSRSAEALLAQYSPGQWNSFWGHAFDGGDSPREPLYLFDKFELVHLQVRAPALYARELLMDPDGVNPWRQLSLRPGSPLPAMAYSNLFAPGQPTMLGVEGAPDSQMAALLNSAFSMRNWPISDIRGLKAELQEALAERWLAFDVGQGSANAFIGKCHIATLFHDLGCGVYANAKTCPSDLALCHTQPAPIVLSHWDSDHWGGACQFAPLSSPMAFLTRPWIVPYDSTIGPTHIAFAASILAAGGRLRVMPPGSWQSAWISLRDGRRLRVLKGSGSDRNGSGMVLEVEHRDERWLVTGDVEYHHLHPHLAPQYTAMSVPHHGSKMKKPHGIPSAAPRYARLIYSFGHDNSFKHPRKECISAHLLQGWDHGKWVPALDATGIAHGNVLATACHSPGADHLDNIVVGWSTAPPVPCPMACHGSQCGADASQS